VLLVVVVDFTKEANCQPRKETIVQRWYLATNWESSPVCSYAYYRVTPTYLL